MIYSSMRTFVAAGCVALLFAACGDGDSSDEANDYCQALRDGASSNPQCPELTDQSFQECVICREECGDACGIVTDICPYVYTCPRD
jgi:hypothetical protein